MSAVGFYLYISKYLSRYFFSLKNGQFQAILLHTEISGIVWINELKCSKHLMIWNEISL